VRRRRVAAGDMLSVPDLPGRLRQRVDSMRLGADTAETVRMLAADLVGYQDERYAARFLDTVGRVASAEQGLVARAGTGDLDPEALTETVARSLHKLMAYKDEYEVARLLLLPEADAAAAEAGRGPRTYLLHPPMLKALGVKGKIRFDDRTRPVFTALARGKRLRGTRLDPFGATAMRRMERALVGEYVGVVARLVAGLRPDTRARAVEIAALPDRVRGYESLKERRAAEYRAAVREAMATYGT
jgi:indolepyruvate ferredoxin oxidoreductase